VQQGKIKIKKKENYERRQLPKSSADFGSAWYLWGEEGGNKLRGSMGEKKKPHRLVYLFLHYVML
jgi:hypothetical protein